MSDTTRTLYTIDEAAEQLRTTTTYIYRLTSSGRIGFYKIGRELRFSQANLDEYLETVAVPARKKLGRPRKAA